MELFRGNGTKCGITSSVGGFVVDDTPPEDKTLLWVDTTDGDEDDDPGKNAYEYAKDGGYMGTEEEFSVKLSTDHIDWFGVGISIPSGADLDTYKTNGKYFANSEKIGSSLLNRPNGMNTNFVMWVFSRTNTSIKSQLMLTLTGKMYIRSSSSSAWRAWQAYTTSGEIETLTEEVKQQLIEELEAFTGTRVKEGLKVAIIGDSISTCPDMNAYEMEIAAADVGISLSSYVTTYDVGKTISLDGATSGYTITDADAGKELSFIPCADDVGKKLGTPKNYNDITDVWWKVAADRLGFEPIAAAWSGSSITSHMETTSGKECSHAWHRHTIRTIGQRIPGSMNRIAPDVVLIYRGTNDLSHSKSVRLTSGYFDKVDWNYPDTDELSGNTYGLKQGLALTIRRIRETYPRAQIVLCTCNVFKRSNYSHFPTHNGYFSIPQMNTAIREVAEFFGCHTIDLDKCGITWENCYSEGYITDSSAKPTHPNSAGHAMLAKQAINDLVRKLHIADIEPSFDEVGDVAPDIETPSGTEGNIGDLNGELVENYYVNKNTGKLVESTLYFSYTNIEVEPGVTYSMPRARNTAFYAADGTKISGLALDGAADATTTAPENAATMATCYKYANLDPGDVVITKL